MYGIVAEDIKITVALWPKYVKSAHMFTHSFRNILIILFCTVFYTTATAGLPRQLSLQESILLAVRQNPNVQISQLNQVIQKFNVAIQKWEFHPHYAFSATHTTSEVYSINRNGMVTTNVSGITPSASLRTPIGTDITLSSINVQSNHYNPGLSLTIIQPLMRGFGRPIVEAELYNAMDSEKISRLNVTSELRNTVTAVINAYLDIVAAKNTLEVDQLALDRGLVSIQDTKAFIKAGHKAGVELVTVEASVANQKTKIETDKNILEQARYALLTTIGLDPNTDVSFSSVDVEALIKKYHVASLEASKQMALTNDVPFQIAKITLNGTQMRALIQAKDNARWKLNLTLNGNVGNGNGGGPNAGINSLVNGLNRHTSAMLELTIPIDDRRAKNAIANAEIALQEACIALKQQKWNLETKTINGWKNIYSAERALKFALDAEKLQAQTYHVSAQKYSYGIIDSLELQTAQQELITAQKSLVINKISYLKALVDFDYLTGKTLDTWHVAVRYH